MNKKEKIQQLLTRLETKRVSGSLTKESAALASQIQSLITSTALTAKDGHVMKSLKALEAQVKKIEPETKASLERVLEAVSKVEEQSSKQLQKLETDFNASLTRAVAVLRGENITEQIQEVTAEIQKQINSFEEGMANISSANLSIEADLSSVRQELAELSDAIQVSLYGNDDNAESIRGEFEKKLRELEQRLNNRLANIGGHGGGNANRNIAIGGNSSVLSTFTDINLKAGTNVTISYAKNQTTKYTDVTIAATGGGSGITREINSVAVDTAAGDTAGIDYVYLVSGTTTITLPTAVGNENLYTIKNVGVGTVTVAFTGGETCDGSATLSLPVQYTSVDLISDTANWHVT